MTFEHHLHYIYNKAKRKFDYLRYFYRNKHVRLSLEFSKILYKTNIRTTIEYASAFWINTPKDYWIHKLEDLQHKVLTLMYNFWPSTPAKVCDYIATIPPLQLRCTQHLFKLYYDCKFMFVHHPTHNLSTSFSIWQERQQLHLYNRGFTEGMSLKRLSPLSEACHRAKLWKIQLPTVPTTLLPQPAPYQNVLLPIPKHCPFTNYYAINYKLDAKKLLKSIQPCDVCIFTDGSAQPNPGYAGAGYVIYFWKNIIEKSVVIPTIESAYFGELLAIEKALGHVFNLLNLQSTTNQYRIVLFSDNMNAVQTIKGIFQNKSSHALHIHKIRTFLLEKWPYIPELYWIKGHASHEGNEIADKLAEKARQSAEQRFPRLAHEINELRKIRHIKDLNDDLAKHWYEDWTNTSKYQQVKLLLPTFREVQHLNKIFTMLPCNYISILSRLISDYNHLNYHLSKTKPNFSPYCTCKKDYETVSHFLLHCKLYERQRNELLLTVKDLFRNHYPEWFLPTYDDLLLYNQLSLKLLLVAFEQPTQLAYQILKATCLYVIHTGRKI